MDMDNVLKCRDKCTVLGSADGKGNRAEMVDIDCFEKCISQSPQNSPSHSSKPTLSGKLTASANNLLDESLKLLSMADEIHDLDSMYL